MRRLSVEKYTSLWKWIGHYYTYLYSVMRVILNVIKLRSTHGWRRRELLRWLGKGYSDWWWVHRWYNRRMAVLIWPCVIVAVVIVRYGASIIWLWNYGQTQALSGQLYTVLVHVCLCLCTHWSLVFCEHGRWILFLLAQEVCSQGSGQSLQCWKRSEGERLAQL